MRLPATPPTRRQTPAVQLDQRAIDAIIARVNTQLQAAGAGRRIPAEETISAGDLGRQYNQSEHATTFLAYGGKGQFCTRRLAADHTQEDCALHPVMSLSVVLLHERTRSTTAQETREVRGACYTFNDGRCTASYCCFEVVWRDPLKVGLSGSQTRTTEGREEESS